MREWKHIWRDLLKQRRDPWNCRLPKQDAETSSGGGLGWQLSYRHLENVKPDRAAHHRANAGDKMRPQSQANAAENHRQRYDKQDRFIDEQNSRLFYSNGESD
jgi:hypothetical protein